MTYVMTRPVTDQRVGPLENAPLKLALVQAQTPPNLPLERSETIEAVTAALPDWVLADRQVKHQSSLRFGPAGVEHLPGQQETVWILADPDERFRAVVSASSVGVECEDYQLWDDFRSALEHVLCAVAATAAPARCSRLGVRYVNELQDELLDGDPAHMARVVAAELLEPSLSVGNPVASSMSETRFQEPNEARLTLRHGLLEDRRFLLDFDHFTEVQQPFEPGPLVASAERFHDRIESLFAWSLNPEYLISLRGPAEEQS